MDVNGASSRHLSVEIVDDCSCGVAPEAAVQAEGRRARSATDERRVTRQAPRVRARRFDDGGHHDGRADRDREGWTAREPSDHGSPAGATRRDTKGSARDADELSEACAGEEREEGVRSHPVLRAAKDGRLRREPRRIGDGEAKQP